MVRPVKKEFNIKSGAATQRYLRAMAFMVPPLLTIGMTQGWQGLLLWTSFTAMAAHWHFWQNPTSFTPEKIKNMERSGQIQSAARLTTLSDRVASRYGMAAVPTKFSTSVKNAAADNRQVFVNPDMAAHMNNREIEWLIAHELDHARHTTDTAIYTAYTAAYVFSAGIGAFSVWGALQNTTIGTQGLAAGVVLGAYAIAQYSLKLAYRSALQGNEFRCDTNALQNTGSLDYAQSALKVAGYGSAFLFHLTYKEPTRMERLHATHPSMTERLKNLDATWKAMQRGANSTHAPAP